MDNITLGELIVWIIVGALVGSLVGRLVTRSKRGFGLIGNIVLGLLGALVGGFLFRVLDIDLGLDDIVISAEGLISAFVGALVIVGLMSIIRSR